MNNQNNNHNFPALLSPSGGANAVFNYISMLKLILNRLRADFRKGPYRAYLNCVTIPIGLSPFLVNNDGDAIIEFGERYYRVQLADGSLYSIS